MRKIVLSTRYRATLETGVLWAESSSPREITQLGGVAPARVTYERLVTWRVEGNWEPWDPLYGPPESAEDET